MDNSNMHKSLERLERQLNEINKSLWKIAKELREQNIALYERRNILKGDGRDELDQTGLEKAD